MFRIGVLLVGIAATLAGCTSTEVLVAHSVPLNSAQETIPEAQLLDVGIKVFDPGVPEGEVDKSVQEELIKEGTFVQIRRTESMYLAVQLRNTLQRSGHWGAVWVTPEPSNAADVNVTAQIEQSDGDTVQLQVQATDATGRVWFDKPYQLETAAGAYNRQRYPELDPYQDVFNMIANDLAAVQADLSPKDSREIRTVGQIRYAADLAPEAFGDYVKQERDGRYDLVRLPAEDDPVYSRTQRVRQRERLFFDTLDQHYVKFCSEAQDSYDSWREYSREESLALKELTRQARWRTGMGIATILASVVYGSNSNNNSFSDRVVRDALMYVGVDMLQSSAVRRQEKRLHTETLQELSSSFDDDVEPLVVEVKGTEHRLTGTVDAQFKEWRGLLKQLFISETGLAPEDMNVYVDSSAETQLDADTPQADPQAQPVTEPLPGEEPPAAAETPDVKEVISDAGGGAAGGA